MARDTQWTDRDLDKLARQVDDLEDEVQRLRRSVRDLQDVDQSGTVDEQDEQMRSAMMQVFLSMAKDKKSE